MNFIWDITLRAQQNKIYLDDLFFSPTADPSPCYEQSLYYLNQKEITDPKIEINPLMRFSEIFQYLLHPDLFYYLERDYQQFILYAFDALVHVLTEIDLCHGLTRREFYVRQLRRDMQQGVYGQDFAKAYALMSREEQLSVADEMLIVIQTGTSLGSFCHIIKQIFPGVVVYQVKKHPQIIYIYLDSPKTVTSEKKWQLIRDTFLPIGMEERVFWDIHFGILGIDATMRSDAIAIF